MLFLDALVFVGDEDFLALLVTAPGVLAFITFLSGLVLICFLGVASCLMESESFGGSEGISFPDPSPLGASGERRGSEERDGVLFGVGEACLIAAST